MTIFISCFHEDAELASALKTWLENAFSKRCDAFISSDADTASSDGASDEAILDALGDARVFLALCGPPCPNRPWIHFQAGYARAKKATIIPLCHSGQDIENLPKPYSDFQALKVESHDFCPALLEAVAAALSLKKIPSIDLAAMRSEIDIAVASAQKPAESPRPSFTPEVEALAPEQITVLKILAGSESELLSDDYLAGELGAPPEKVRLLLKDLEEEGLIESHGSAREPAGYGLSIRGRGYMVRHGLV